MTLTRHLVALAAVTCLVAGCSRSPTSGHPSAAGGSPASITGAGSTKTACELITPDVIAAAHFTQPVMRERKTYGVGKHGSSACAYGDDPDPTHLSSNYLALLIMTPAALKALHTTGMDEARAVAYPCTAKTIREIGPGGGIGSQAYFCARYGHSPDGGWLQGDNVYLLEAGDPKVDYGTTEERVSEFESVARAIARNVGARS